MKPRRDLRFTRFDALVIGLVSLALGIVLGAIAKNPAPLAGVAVIAAIWFWSQKD